MEMIAEIGNPVHKPVMVEQAIEFLSPRPDGVYIDATIGFGGHTDAILKHSGGRAKVVGFDMDDEAINSSKKRFSKFGSQVAFVNRNFSEIDGAIEALGIIEVDGIIADLGMSSFQIERSGRGFSFLRAEPLDMRMDGRLRFTAYDLLNEMDEEEIGKIIKTYGEERWAKRIAERIVRFRREKPVETTSELAKIVSEAIPQKFHPLDTHPATKTFQSLRIAVNGELENLERFLERSVHFLKNGARIVVISFHSLEDRLIKNAFKRFSSPCVCPPKLPRCGCDKKRVLRVLTTSPLKPDVEEVIGNHRARSAKLRAAERVQT